MLRLYTHDISDRSKAYNNKMIKMWYVSNPPLIGDAIYELIEHRTCIKMAEKTYWLRTKYGFRSVEKLISHPAYEFYKMINMAGKSFIYSYNLDIHRWNYVGKSIKMVENLIVIAKLYNT